MSKSNNLAIPALRSLQEFLRGFFHRVMVHFVVHHFPPVLRPVPRVREFVVVVLPKQTVDKFVVAVVAAVLIAVLLALFEQRFCTFLQSVKGVGGAVRGFALACLVQRAAPAAGGEATEARGGPLLGRTRL